jgi:hypothetical protein
LRTLCVYCGSSDLVDHAYLDAAAEMGTVLAERSITLIYGGGSTGLMGRLADAVLQHGGQAIGVIPVMFETPELQHTGLTELQVVGSMHERKARMVELADGFVALPGGFGTFDELFEILTWSQIGIHTKPIGVLNVNAYFAPLLSLIDHAKSERFIYLEHSGLLVDETSPAKLLDRLEEYSLPAGLERWVHRKEQS